MSALLPKSYELPAIDVLWKGHQVCDFVFSLFNNFEQSVNSVFQDGLKRSKIEKFISVWLWYNLEG